MCSNGLPRRSSTQYKTHAYCTHCVQCTTRFVRPNHKFTAWFTAWRPQTPPPRARPAWPRPPRPPPLCPPSPCSQNGLSSASIALITSDCGQSIASPHATLPSALRPVAGSQSWRAAAAGRPGLSQCINDNDNGCVHSLVHSQRPALPHPVEAQVPTCDRDESAVLRVLQRTVAVSAVAALAEQPEPAVIGVAPGPIDELRAVRARVLHSRVHTRQSSVSAEGSLDFRNTQHVATACGANVPRHTTTRPHQHCQRGQRSTHMCRCA